MSENKQVCAPNDDAFCYDKGVGLTKREYFAAMAMQALLSTGEAKHRLSRAESAVAHADALIEALNKVQS